MPPPYPRVDTAGTADPVMSEAAKEIFGALDPRNAAASVASLMHGLRAILPEARARSLEYALLAEVRREEHATALSTTNLCHELDALRSHPPNALRNSEDEVRQLEREGDAIRHLRAELKQLTSVVEDLRPVLPDAFQSIADHIRRSVSTAAPRTVIAVAGNVKAGKSTLVNVLIGVPFAAVGQEACSALPIAYVHDASFERGAVELHLPEKAREAFVALRPCLSQRYAAHEHHSVDRAQSEALMTPQQYATEAWSAEACLYRPHSVEDGMAVWRGRDAVAALLPHLHTIARAALRVAFDENSRDDALLRAAVDALRALLPQLCPEVRLRFSTLPPVLLDGSEIALVDLPGANEAGTDMSLYLPSALSAATAIFLVRSASNLAETRDDEETLFPAIATYGLGKPLHVIFTHGSEMTSRMVQAKVAALAQYQLRVQNTYTVESTFAERAMAFWDVVSTVLSETKGASHVLGQPQTYETLRNWCHESRCNAFDTVEMCRALQTRDASILTTLLRHNLAFFHRSGAGALIEAFCSRVHEEAVLAHAMRGGQLIANACTEIRNIISKAGTGTVATLQESVQRHESFLIQLKTFENVIKDLRQKCRANVLPSVAAVGRLNGLIAEAFTNRRAATADRTRLALYDWWFDTDPRVALAAVMGEDVTRLCVEHGDAVWTEVASAARDQLAAMAHAGWTEEATGLASLTTDRLAFDDAVSFGADDVGTITLAVWWLFGASPQTTAMYEDAARLLDKPAALLSRRLLERVDIVHVALKSTQVNAHLQLASAVTTQKLAAQGAVRLTEFASKLDVAETAVKNAYADFNATIRNHTVRNAAAAAFLQLNVESTARKEVATLLGILTTGSLAAKLDQAYRKKGPLVLALCGGGMKGLMTVRVLQELERRLQRRNPTLTVSKAFDVVYGTSTGAIIAAMLKAGHPLARISEFYTIYGKDVFKPSMLRWGIFRASYSAESLQTQAQEALGTHTTMKQMHAQHSSSFKLRVVAFDVEAGHPRVFTEHDDVPAWQTVRASSAAPTYFEPMRINNRRYCDGGLHMNNPALQALEESPRLLVNVGTGLGGQAAKPSAHGALGWARAAPDVAMRGHEQAVPEVLKQRMGADYVYLDHDMGNELPSLDAATPEAIANLEAAAREFILSNSIALEQLADRIVADHGSR